MLLALAEAEQALLQGEVPVGAVVARGDAVLARAHNQSGRRGDATAHAELLALQAALQATKGQYLGDCTLFVTLEPCAMCAGAALNARVEGIVFGAFDEQAGCCGSVIDLTDAVLPRTVRCVGGVMEEACAALLRQYFQAKRV
jgi:tRNA(adenine34) deaminase